MTSYREITPAQLQDDTEGILKAVQDGISAAIVDADRHVLAWLVPPREADRQAPYRGRRPEARDEPPVREIEPETKPVDPVLSESIRRLLASSGMSPTAGSRRNTRSKGRVDDADYLARQRLHQRPGSGEHGIGR